MDKVYIVKSYFEDFDSSSIKIIGVFTDKKIAQETLEKWKEFYETKKISILEKPKKWKPDEQDLKLGLNDWTDSIEYAEIMSDYRDIIIFKEIFIDEHQLNQDLSLQDEYLNDNLLSLMTQWNRNHILNKLV
jgi:hypothetical protein